jgi:hypothetical protein
MKIKVLLLFVSFLSINLFKDSTAAAIEDLNNNTLKSFPNQDQIISNFNIPKDSNPEEKLSKKSDFEKIPWVFPTYSNASSKIQPVLEKKSPDQKHILLKWGNNSKIFDSSIDYQNNKSSNTLPTNIPKNKISNHNANKSKVLSIEEGIPANTETASHKNNTNTIAVFQSGNGDLMRKPVGFSDLDFSTPSSPGATMINYKGDFGSVSTPNEIAIKLLNGLSSDGKFQPGIAIDISPYLLASGTGFTLADYRKPNAGFQRFLANTKVSIATAGSEKEALLGIGAEFILLNEGDPRFDETLFNDFREILKDQPPPDANLIAFNNSIKQRIIVAKEQAKKRSEQKETWTLGIGASLVSSTGRYYDFRGNGMGIWTTYKRGMGGNSELILHGNYRSSERTSDRIGSYINVDTVTLGTRIRTGDDKFKFSLETAYNFESQGGTASNSYFSLGLGAEPKISDNLWLSLSMTGNIGRQNGNDVQVFSGLKWNFNSGK